MTPAFEPRHIRDLFGTVEEAIPWRWHRMLPDGALAILVAFMKVGKSTLAYELAVSVAKGQPFLNLPTTQGNVLIIAAEEHHRDSVQRLRHFGATESDPIWVVSGPLPQAPLVLDPLRSFVKEHHIRFIIIDTFASYFAGVLRKEDDNAEVSTLLMPIVSLCRHLDVTILFTHHERKSGGEDGRGIRGAGAIFALMDQALILRKVDGSETRRMLEVEGRHKWDSPGTLVLDYADERYVSLGTPDDQTRAAQQTKVLAVLPSTEPGFGVKETARASGLGEATVRRVLADLHSGRKAKRSGKGSRHDPFRYWQADSTASQGTTSSDNNGVASDHRSEGETADCIQAA